MCPAQVDGARDAAPQGKHSSPPHRHQHLVTAGCRFVMGLTRLLRKSAALPLRVAEAAANTTAGVITGLVRFAGTAATTVVGGGVALATAPVRSAAGLLTDVAESH